MAWRARNPEALNKVLDDAIDLVFSNDRLSLAEALVEAWNASKCDPRGVDFPVLYSYLDNFTRGKDRIELIRSITHAKVHVFGELSPDNPVGILGWKQYLKAQSNVTVHPPMLYSEIFPILKRAKIVLNSMPFFRDGTHERVFNALACGGLPVTSESIYLHEQFKDGKEMLFYKAADRGAVNAKIDDFLAHEEKRKEVVDHGRAKVMKHHTWDARVEQLAKDLPPIIKKIHQVKTNG
jgi:glycosyltransferase involved in cell wall biosynthesis